MGAIVRVIMADSRAVLQALKTYAAHHNER